MLKQTSLYDAHVQAGAKIVPFAGWEMPVHYGSILDEVRTVRSSAGIFDVSHMGEVRVEGPGALAAVQSLLTNNAAKLSPGRAQYSLLCKDDGGILDDLIVYRWDEGAETPDFLIVVNASNRDKDFSWMTTRGQGPDVRWTDLSDNYALIALQGPDAPSLLQPLTPDTDLAQLRPFSHTDARLHTREHGPLDVHIARTGYTGEDGFEIFSAWDDAPAIWDTLAWTGAKPCGLGARDVLRIEASYPLYGHEITEETHPYEAGLGWVVKPEKGEFTGRDAMVSAKEAGLKRRLRGILPEDRRAIPREGMEITVNGGTGRVTSGTFSPTLDRAIAMAYVPADATGEATVPMRGKEIPAHIVTLPFYKREAKASG